MRVRLNKQNFDWKMKLKAKNTLAKRPTKKITNQKNSDKKKNTWKIIIERINWKKKLL
jgi:hypothetical protein